MSIYGYIRISSKDQNESRQYIAMIEKNVKPEFIFVDKVSGKDFNRPNYKRMIKKVVKGDLIVIKSIDRLGRNYKEIIEQWRIITQEKGVDICVIDMPLLDTTRCKDLLGTFISDIVLQLLSFVAENERDSIKQRQREGIQAAKIRGIKFGRPRKQLPSNSDEIILNWKNKTITTKQAIEQLKVSESTFYRIIKRMD